MKVTSGTISDINVGGIPSSCVPNAPKVFPGKADINGPLTSGITVPELPLANAIFGPGINPGFQVSLASVGQTDIFGKFNTYAFTNVAGITNIFGLTTKNAVSIKNAIGIANGLKLGNAPVVFNGSLTANGGIYVPDAIVKGAICDFDFGAFKKVAAPFKEFDIKHPSKAGYRLIHACLEGPEIGVYYRGHLTSENKITLPDYWENLIDIETITVHLTPHKFHQELYVKSIEWGKIIHIVNNNGGPIDCDYIVYAERKDIEKLKVEVIDKK